MSVGVKSYAGWLVWATVWDAFFAKMFQKHRQKESLSHEQ